MLVKEPMPKGWKGSDVLMIAISQARQNGKNRTAGVTRALDEGGSRIVQFLQSEDHPRAEAHGQALDLLTANPDAHGFFTEHDEATLGTCGDRRLRQYRECDSGRLRWRSGIGRVDPAQGKLRGASMQQPMLMGRNSMDVAWRFLQGEEVDKETSVPTILVTPDNLKDTEKTLQGTVFPVEGGGTPETLQPVNPGIPVDSG